MLYFIILYYAMQSYTMLYNTVLYYIILYYVIPGFILKFIYFFFRQIVQFQIEVDKDVLKRL